MSIDRLTSQLCDQFNNLSLTDSKAIEKGSHKMVLSALNAFLKKQFPAFDALVGDAACQTRAIMVAALAQNESVIVTCKKDLQMVTACNLAIQKNAKNHACSCCISQESLELAKMYLLQTTRTIHPAVQECSHCKEKTATFKEKTEAGKLSGIYKTNIAHLKTMVNCCSQALASESISFLQEQAKSASSEMTQKMISQENTFVLNERKEIPCFYSLQAVMDIAKARQIPLLIKVKKSEHAMEKSHKDPFDTAILEKNGKESVLLQDPLIIIEGMRINEDSQEVYQQNLLKMNMAHLIQCNAAQHSQYTGNKGLASVPLLQKEEYSEEKKNLEILAEQAKSLGCHDKNRALFCITHIFCDTMEHQIQSGVKL
jgi:hypothetical protein